MFIAYLVKVKKYDYPPRDLRHRLQVLLSLLFLVFYLKDQHD